MFCLFDFEMRVRKLNFSLLVVIHFHEQNKKNAFLVKTKIRSFAILIAELYLTKLPRPYLYFRF